MSTGADAGFRRESSRSRSAAAETPLPVNRGSLLAVIKAVLLGQWWVPEPKLLDLLHSHGVGNAERSDFGKFFVANPGLLDRMMSGTGNAAKGHECILINLSQHGAAARVRYYYKLARETDSLLYPSPNTQPKTRESKPRQRRTLPAQFISAFNAEYHAPTQPPLLQLPATLRVFEMDKPATSKVQRRVRNQSPRPSLTPTGSCSRFGDKQVSKCLR